MMENDFEIEELQHILEYSFNKHELLQQSLTHRSVNNESEESTGQHNERLEFLGDAVIDLSIGHQLMEYLPSAREGELSKLRSMIVKEASLALSARSINLGHFLRLGRGEEQTGGREKSSILADAFEAIIGAIFLDGGYLEADRVVRRILEPLIAEAVEGQLDKDHKTRLQEICQSRWRQAPHYKVIDEKGPDHAKIFTIAVYLEKREIARGEGGSKKSAEQNAARRALEIIQDEGFSTN